MGEYGTTLPGALGAQGSDESYRSMAEAVSPSVPFGGLTDL